MYIYILYVGGSQVPKSWMVYVRRKSHRSKRMMTGGTPIFGTAKYPGAQVFFAWARPSTSEIPILCANSVASNPQPPKFQIHNSRHLRRDAVQCC